MNKKKIMFWGIGSIFIALCAVLFYSWTYDDSALLVCQHDGRLGCYDLENKKYKKLFKGGYGFPQYEISDDGQYLLWNDKVRVSKQIPKQGDKTMGKIYLVKGDWS